MTPMKTKLIAFALTFIFSGAAFAAGPPEGESSLTIGAAYSKISLIEEASISGLNIKYQFEPENNRSIGFMGSFTYTSGSDRIRQPAGPSAKIDTTYFSIAFGPSYRFNHLAAAYAMLGIAGAKADVSGGVSVSDYFAPVFAAGLRISPTKRLVVDAHYEKAGVQSGRKHVDGDTYMIGIGVRF